MVSRLARGGIVAPCADSIRFPFLSTIPKSGRTVNSGSGGYGWIRPICRQQIGTAIGCPKGEPHGCGESGPTPAIDKVGVGRNETNNIRVIGRSGDGGYGWIRPICPEQIGTAADCPKGEPHGCGESAPMPAYIRPGVGDLNGSRVVATGGFDRFARSKSGQPQAARRASHMDVASQPRPQHI